MDAASVQVTPESHPGLSGREHRFFEFWLDHVVDLRDPHLPRWVDYEEGAVARARDRTAALDAVEPVEGKRVLEIGCQNGAGLVSLAQAGADPTGIDVVPPSIDAARVRAECWSVAVKAHVGDAGDLQFDSSSFDIVTSTDVIEHVPDKEAMVRECLRVLRPGGLLMIAAPQRFSIKHLRADPHYQYAGVSVFPARLISRYLTRFRGEPVYEVETLPTAHGIRRMMRRHGAAILDLPVTRPLSGLGARVPAGAWPWIDELRQGFTIFARRAV